MRNVFFAILCLVPLFCFTETSHSSGLVCRFLDLGCENITWDDSVERHGVIYKRFTDEPFNGSIEQGLEQGHLRDGKKNGHWESYWPTGQLNYKGFYKDNKRDESWVYYLKNGQLSKKSEYNDGEANGPVVGYYQNGQIEFRGNYKNDRHVGIWFWYEKNGQLRLEKTYGTLP